MASSKQQVRQQGPAIGDPSMRITPTPSQRTKPRTFSRFAGGGPVSRLVQSGVIDGPGTGTSDSISADVPHGSYILPADTTRRVKLSNGETQLPPDAVMAVGAAALDVLRQMTHRFVSREPGPSRAARLADGGSVGVVRDERGNVSFSPGNVDATPTYSGAGEAGLTASGAVVSEIGGAAPDTSAAALPLPGGGESPIQAFNRVGAALSATLGSRRPFHEGEGAAVGFADGGYVEPSAALASVQPSAQSDIPQNPERPDPQADMAAFGVPPSMGRRPSDAAAPPAAAPSFDQQVLPRIRAVLRGSGEDASANVNAGNFAGAVGSVVRGAAAALPALATDVVAPWASSIGDVGGRLFSGLTGASAAPAQPVAAAGPSAAAAPAAAQSNARDQLAARGALGAGPAAPNTAAAGASAPAATAVPGAPGAFRFVDASGRVLYSDQPAGGVAASATAPPAPVNTVQGGAALSSGLDQRLAQAQAAAVARGESLGPSAAANLPAGYGAVIPPDRQAEHNAQFDREVLAGRIMRNGGTQAAAAVTALMNEPAKLAAEAQAASAREAGATERTRITDTGQTLRERETNASKEKTEGPLRAAQTTEAQAKAAGLQAVQKATADYQRAVASGDKAAIAKAEDALRAAQGKWEKTQVEAFQGIPIPGGVDPATGLPMGSGFAVVNKSDGTYKVVSPSEAKAAAPTPKFETGKVYRDAQGNRAKWDGSKFVPI